MDRIEWYWCLWIAWVVLSTKETFLIAKNAILECFKSQLNLIDRWTNEVWFPWYKRLDNETETVL